MKVYGLQFGIAWEDKAANYARVSERLSASTEAGSLIVLPEMFATGFSMNVARIAEPHTGPTLNFLSNLARTHQAFVLGGVVSRTEDGRGRNEAVVMNPAGEELARYCKLHPFSFANETDHYVPGDGIVAFEWGGVSVAPLICYDLRFPENFRQAVKRGAELFVVIANWPAPRESHWTALLQARAIENQAYVIGVNRCGADPGNAYSGRSMILGPRGEILADAGSDEGIISAEVDIAALRTYRAEFPALADMRDD